MWEAYNLLKEANKMLAKLQAILAGKKTYMVATAAVLTALIQIANGGDTQDAIQQIITAILAMTVRAGVAKK